MFNKLKIIAKEFNERGLNWALGGSLILYYYNLVDKPNDIDIMVCEKDYEVAHSILLKMGKERPIPSSDNCQSTRFSKYLIDDVKVDLISGFILVNGDKVFHYILDDKAVSKIIDLESIDIPLGSLEDWFVLYSLMPNRDAKVKVIKDYLLTHDVNSELLERACEQDITKELVQEIKHILKK